DRGDRGRSARRGRRKALISKRAFLNVMRVSRVVMFVGFTPKDKAAQNRKSLTAEDPKKNGRRGRRQALISKRAFLNVTRFKSRHVRGIHPEGQSCAEPEIFKRRGSQEEWPQRTQKSAD